MSIENRVNKLTNEQIISILNCKERLNEAVKFNPLLKWSKIIKDTLIYKISIGEIDEIELLIVEQGN